MYVVYVPVMSVQEILYLRCILGHQIGGFRASEGSPKKHECLRQGYANYGNKFWQLLFTVQKEQYVAI